MQLTNQQLNHSHSLLGYDRSPVLVNNRPWQAMEKFRDSLHEQIVILPIRHRYELSLKTRNPHERMISDQIEHTKLINSFILKGYRGSDYRGYSLESLVKAADALGVRVAHVVPEIQY